MKKSIRACILFAMVFCACNNTAHQQKQIEKQQLEQTAKTETSEQSNESNAGQTGTIFLEITMQEALDKSKTEKKPIFLYCHSKTCAPCKMMKKRIFPQQECADYINNNYIAISRDMEEGEGIELAQRYNVNIYPTFIVIDSEGNKVGELIGGEKDVKKFIEKIEEAAKGNIQ